MSSPDWRVAPPDFSPTLLDWACTSGSLTQRLVATGLPFAVVVTQQGTAYPTADEADYLTLPLRQPVLVREVLLTLADQPVVFARSLTADPANTGQQGQSEDGQLGRGEKCSASPIAAGDG